MSRSGYDDDCDGWDLIRWRGAVQSAIKGKRGQAFLRELRDALLALPEKSLCTDDVARRSSAADPDGQVCAIGALALKRKMDAGQSRVDAITVLIDEFRGVEGGEILAESFNIAGALAKELMFVNDEDLYEVDPPKRYAHVLAWVESQIAKEPK